MTRFFCLILVLVTSVAQAGEATVESVRTWAGPGRTRVVFDLSRPVQHNVFTLSSPDRVVIDLNGARLAKGAASEVDEKGVVDRIRSAPRHHSDLRVVLDLKGDVQVKSFLVKPNRKYGNRLVVDLRAKDKGAEKPVISAAQEKPRQLLVAIDAGHGGEDPGAIGHHGSYEKNVTLAVALKLAHLVNADPGMKAILTRKGDYYVGLAKRREMARKHHADLFVSIHCDSSAARSARGTTVYTLSRHGATTQAARLLAERENSADLIGGVSLDDKDDLVKSVLVDLSRAATVESSVELADSIIAQMGQIGELHRDDAERAGFVVLKSLDMPSVLVELNYISNPSEERRMTTKSYQWKAARALFAGVHDYAANHLPPGVRVAASQEHVVRRGETLSGIADSYQVSLHELRQANDLNSDRILAGTTLVIPN